ncbi:MAG: hypothetical protein AVDCRST_MAG04-2510, partial [uncultured Acetobacteraceae bacterium]
WRGATTLAARPTARCTPSRRARRSAIPCRVCGPATGSARRGL